MKSNFEQIKRQLMIVSLLKRFQILSAETLFDMLEKGCRSRNFDYPSQMKSRLRLMQRDITAISQTMYIDIVNKRNHGYYIANSQKDAPLDYETLFADFDLLTSMQPNLEVNRYILAEHHRGIGSENLFPLLDAMKNSNIVMFDYCFVRLDDKVRQYKVAPYFLKENQRRWYLVAEHEGVLKTFGIDRITNLENTGEFFHRNVRIDAADMFKNCYGIWDDPDAVVEYVELKYDSLDGKFLKSLPLHSSQKIICDNEKEFRISLNIKITNDFKMALLSRARSLEVIAPLHLRQYVADVASGCMKRNKDL